MRTKGIGPQGLGISPLKNHEAGHVIEPGSNIISDEEARSETIDTEYGEQDVIASDMTTGRSGHLDEVVITAPKTYSNKKTRTEHRLDKTQAKLETSEDTVGGGEKSNRLRRREARLEDKVARQKGRNKKKYARKAGKEKRSKNW